MKPDNVDFGGFLKMLRQRAKLTVRELGVQSGVSHSYLTQMENGKRGIPSPDILKKIAEPLLISYDELMIRAGYLDTEYSYQYPLFETDVPLDGNVLALFVFGINIRKLRESCGLSIQEASKEIGLPLEVLEKIEKGTRNITSDTMNLICDYYGKDPFRLIHSREYFDQKEEYQFAQLSISRYNMFKANQEEDYKIEQVLSFLRENGDKYQATKVLRDFRDDLVVQIPIYGTIKAGYDYVAQQNIVGYKFASKLEVSDGEYYYLVVKGDSMIDEGILDGYHVLVKKQTFVENGKIGVVIINGDEVTLKRVFYNGNQVILQASNRNIPPRVLPVSEVLIQGQVKSVVFDV